MWIFLTLIILLSFIYTIINMSLFSKKKAIIFYGFIFGLVSLLMFPRAIQFSLINIKSSLNERDLLSIACTFQVLESIVFLLLSVRFIKTRYQDEVSSFFNRAIKYIPSGVFIAGIFMAETYLFNTISHISFLKTALIFSAGLAVILSAGALIVKIIIPGWSARMELKVIISFIQIMLGMFLPLILTGLKISGTQLNVPIQGSIISWAGLIIICLAGLHLETNKLKKETS